MDNIAIAKYLIEKGHDISSIAGINQNYAWGKDSWKDFSVSVKKLSPSSEIKNDAVAYLQVRDISENQNEKVFIFNGWTFASDPSLTPFDHAIYDLQLLNCNNA